MLQRKSYLFITAVLVIIIGFNLYGRGRQAMLHHLLQAAGAGDTNSVRSLLRWGLSPNETEAGTSFCGSPAVVAAACSGQAETLRLLLDQGGNANDRGPKGQTALTLALLQRQHDTALLLLQHGADPNRLSPRLQVPMSTLSASATVGWTDVMQKALEKGAPPNGGPIDGATDRPLCMATASGQKAAVRLLLDRGASPAACLDNGMNALMCAANAGQADIADLLLRRGAHIQAVDSYGGTPLIWAAQSGDRSTVKQLLQSGADINVRDQDGLTPIVYASGAGDPATVHLLLEKGADLRGKLGYEALLSAMQVGLKDPAVFFVVPEIKKRAIVRDLLAHGASPNPAYALNKPKQERRVANSLSVNLYLLNVGFNLYFASHNGITPLLFSGSLGHGNITQLLLQHGADIHARDRDGRTALMYAIARRNLDAIQVLLTVGAEVNAHDRHGRTVLEYALNNGNPVIVQRLIARGVDLNAIGDRPYTPLRIAMQAGQTRIAKLLKEAGAKD